jgi:small subunit ribosomal protein S20
MECTLANTAQAKKRARQAEKRRQHNASQRSEMRTFLKRVVKAIREGNRELAATEYRLATSMVDRFANSGLIHKNKAARHKSRLNAHIKEMTADKAMAS